MVLSKLDEMGKLAWVAVIFVAFWTAWPLGLAVLAFLVGSGRLGAWGGARGAWCNLRSNEPGAPAGRGRRRRAAASGNQAFDDYRDETLRRLEEEQREFQDYLERLRRARDKAEFDGFMDERRRNPGAGEPGMRAGEPA
jgi:hypothetical protein